jgi:RimJ/RimL family protein N-acetyltransferase
MNAFKEPPHLSGWGFAVAAMKEDDRTDLRAAAGDPLIWAGHPATNRYKPEIFDQFMSFLLAAGGAVTIRKGTDVIGCSRFYGVPDQPADIGIGFTFITRDHWGGEANWAIKCLMHDYAFQHVINIWFHISPTNIRSQKATVKLGAHFAYDAELDLGTGKSLWKCYRLSKADWQKAKAQRP